MGDYRFPRIRTSFVAVDQKNNANVRNEEVLKNIETFFLVNTTQEVQNVQKQEANGAYDIIGNDIIFIVQRVHD